MVHDHENAEASDGVEILVPIFHEREHLALAFGLNAVSGCGCLGELQLWVLRMYHVHCGTRDYVQVPNYHVPCKDVHCHSKAKALVENLLA
jgi:hypothetical protein